MAGGSAAERWDGVLENIQRTNQTPIARNIRTSLSGGKSGVDLPAGNAYSVIAGLYVGAFIELWAADHPQDPALQAALQPVHDAARALTPYESLEPQIDRIMATVSVAREALSNSGGGTFLTADQIISDMEMWLKVALLVAGTSHVGPMKLIDDEIAHQAEAARRGIRLPPRHFDFATNEIVHVFTKTSISLAAFAAAVDTAIATSWAEAIQPDPADQPSIMKQFAAQLIVTFYTEWEEYYRPALGTALGCDPEAIRWDYFGDIRNMRQDYVHSRGVCKNSARNKVLKWFSKNQTMIPTPVNYVELLTQFPAGQLKVLPPTFQRDRKRVEANAKATTVAEFEKITAATNLSKDAALEQALEEWIAAHQIAE